MENATNALLIAGGVLIAIIIISMAVYLYTIYSNQSREYSETISNLEIQKFNSKFEVYIGRTDIKPQEIVSAVNLSKEYGGTVTIIVQGVTLIDKENSKDEDFLINLIKQDITYRCDSYEYIDDKIQTLKFLKNS